MCGTEEMSDPCSLTLSPVLMPLLFLPCSFVPPHRGRAAGKDRKNKGTRLLESGVK